MEPTIYEKFTNGALNASYLHYVAISLDKTTDPVTIDIVQNTNIKFLAMTRYMVVQAVLIEETNGVTVTCSSTEQISFTLKIFHDCSNFEGLTVLQPPTSET